MITEIEQETTDIDWFFTNGEEIGFVASEGGKLPESVSKSRENTELLGLYFRNLEQRCDIMVNPNLSKIIPKRALNDMDFSYFINMAEKGLYSFDKTVLNRHSDAGYHLVAKPLNPLKFSELPLEIAGILTETKIEGAIEDVLNIISLY